MDRLKQERDLTQQENNLCAQLKHYHYIANKTFDTSWTDLKSISTYGLASVGVWLFLVTLQVTMAINWTDILDSALLRPDRKIGFPPPNEQARLDNLKIFSRRMNLTRGINVGKIAEQMGDSSGAEGTETCMYALRERPVHVIQEDFKNMSRKSYNSAIVKGVLLK